MMYGADSTISYLLFKAFIPATLGNIVGGRLLVLAVYWYVFDSLASSEAIFARIRDIWARNKTKSSMGDATDNDKEN